MGHLLNRLKFAEEQFDNILSKSKQSKRKPVKIQYKTGIELTICLGGFAHRKANANFGTNGYNKDVISFFPFGVFFMVSLSLLSLLIIPIIYIFSYTFVLIYYVICLTLMVLFQNWFTNEKRSKFDNFVSNNIVKIYPISLYHTMKFYSSSAIHELTHFYDKRIDSLNYYNNFKNVDLDSKDERYYNEKTEINAHLVSILYKLKNKKFNSFESFYKKVSKHDMFKYLTDDNKKLIYKYLDEYYHEMNYHDTKDVVVSTQHD